MKQHFTILALGLVFGMGSQPVQATNFALPSSVWNDLLSLQFSGEDINNDGNLALEELTNYQANWLGDAGDPAFSHTKNELTSFNYQYGDTLLDSSDDLSLSIASSQLDEYSFIDINGVHIGFFEELCDPDCQITSIFSQWNWETSVENWPPPPLPPPPPIPLPPGGCICSTLAVPWPPVAVTEYIQDGERLVVLVEPDNDTPLTSVPEPNLNIALAILGLGGLIRKLRIQK